MSRRPFPGRVFLVGAGPGDPGLITRRGFELLHSADVIVMDALVNPALVRDVPGRVIGAGKRGSGNPHTQPSQSEINRLLVRLARSGKTVVRLKGGDPFVFGRGSEELEVLVAARVPFEIVPGISSAIAAPAYAGIPVTDRRLASQVTFITGHEGKDVGATGPGVDWRRLSPRGTLVILMGVGRWGLIQKRLLQNGWPSGIPVAAVESATTADQRVLRTTLGNSVAYFSAQRLSSPSVIVVGDVARLSGQMGWVAREKPLLGRRIVVTRAEEKSRVFAEQLAAKGAEAIVCPVIAVKSRRPSITERKILQRKWDWLVFLSANGVESFAKFYGKGNSRLAKRVLAIGPRTRDTARRAGWRGIQMAPYFHSAGVKKALGNVRGQAILIPRGENAPPELTRDLRAAGARVTEFTVYRTEAVGPLSSVATDIRSGVDAVTFTSASTVKFFFKGFGISAARRIFKHAVAVSIGPSTTKALRAARVRRILQAPGGTMDGLLELLERRLASHVSPSSVFRGN